MLLADPCFQLRSICYLLGQPEPPAPGTALPTPDQKRFSLQSCKLVREERGLELGQESVEEPISTWEYSPATFGLTSYRLPDTDYISIEELAQVEQMLAHLTSASAQAAAASLVSRAPDTGPHPPHLKMLAQLGTHYIGIVCVHLYPTPAHPTFCSLQPTSEEDLCPICYAHPISAVFQPCGHKSCK